MFSTCGRTYHVVVNAKRGFPYGSFRGGAGIRVTRRDGAPFEGFDASVDPNLARAAVRAEVGGAVCGGAS